MFGVNCNDDMSAVPDNKLLVKGVKPSIPNKVRSDSIVSGMPCAWFK